MCSRNDDPTTYDRSTYYADNEGGPTCGFGTCQKDATGYAPWYVGEGMTRRVFEQRSACDEHGSDRTLRPQPERIEVDGHIIDLTLNIYIEFGGSE